MDAFESSLPKGQGEGKGEEEPDEEWVATMLGQVRSVQHTRIHLVSTHLVMYDLTHSLL